MEERRSAEAMEASVLESGIVSSGEGLAHVKVRRYDPTAGGQPSYDEFDGIPFADRSVLDVLHSIYQERDPSLAYRHVCTKGFCGSCMLVVNGLPVLACQYPALADMTIEPHPKFPVIRDLVVGLGLDVAEGRKDAVIVGDAAAGSSAEAVSAVGSRADIDPKACVHCQDCVAVCPVGVYSFVSKRVKVIDPDSCLGPSCNMCVDTCWKMAIKMVPRGNHDLQYPIG